MGLTDSYAYFLPVHALYQIVSIKLCHNILTKQSRRLSLYKQINICSIQAPLSIEKPRCLVRCLIRERGVIRRCGALFEQMSRLFCQEIRRRRHHCVAYTFITLNGLCVFRRIGSTVRKYSRAYLRSGCHIPSLPQQVFCHRQAVKIVAVLKR